MVSGTYVPAVWIEHGHTSTEKRDRLNHLETQHAEMVYYTENLAHNIYTKAEADARYYRTAAHPSGRSDTGAGCGIDADLLHGLSLADVLELGIPAGMIGMWGAGDLPSGWIECTGASSTPNMQDRTPFGCGAGVTCGATGGVNSVTPTASSFDSSETTLTSAQIPKHRHVFSDKTPNSTTGEGYSSSPITFTTGKVAKTTGNILPGDYSSMAAHKHSGNTFTLTGYTGDLTGAAVAGSVDNRPPSRAVKFIMRS